MFTWLTIIYYRPLITVGSRIGCIDILIIDEKEVISGLKPRLLRQNRNVDLAKPDTSMHNLSIKSATSHFTILIALALFCVFSACNSSDQDASATNTATEKDTPTAVQKEQKNNETVRPRIVFFGNSLTAGYGLDEQFSFPSLIQRKIDSLGYNYDVVNAGLSGETTAGGRNRISWVMEQPMEIFVLELGGNDVLRGFELSVTRKNLAAILDEVRDKYPDVKLVLAGMEAPPNMGEAYTTTFRKIYRDLAREKNAALIPFLLEDVGGIAELNLPDRIHPNQEGQKIVAQNVWEVIAPLLTPPTAQ